MKYASDFRQSARDALRGKWGLAVLAGIIASLLGAGGTSVPSYSFEYNVEEGNASFNLSEFLSAWWILIGGFLAVILIVVVIISIAMLIIGSVVDVGYSKFNLELIDNANPAISNLFDYFKYWKSAVLMNLLRGLYVFLWSLLFVIPGIIATYRYAMASYILAEHPELPVNEAITRSKEMMQGNKFRLFCLMFSFIGWDILCVLTFGIGNFWLVPYKKAAMADFYREVSGTRAIVCDYSEVASEYIEE